MTEDWPSEMQDVWENSTIDLPLGAYMAFSDEGRELFEEGWMTYGEGGDAQAARDAFFTLMSEYDLNVENFDWDSWRDWYEA